MFPVTSTATAKTKNHFFVDPGMGGWGGLTLGLITPTTCGEKSFGVYGTDATVTDPCTYTSH